MKFSFKLATTVLALMTASFAGVSVSSPANGATVGSPVQVVATATSNTDKPIGHTKVYVDNVEKFATNSGNVNTSIAMATGWRYIVVQAWDGYGNVQRQTMNVNVSGTTAAPAPTTSGVTVSQPSNGASVSTPLRVVSTSTDPSGIGATHVYVDGQLKFQTSGANVDTTISLTAGWHQLVVQSWTGTGQVIKSSAISVNVTTSTTTQPVTAPVGTLISDIDQMSGWEHCDRCSGADGWGAATPYSMTQNRVDPSLDGRSAEFWVGGDTPYASALWWKQLGGNSNAYNFVYDISYYIKDPNAAQALEFDVNQSVNGWRYIFGTECNLRESRVWRLWDTANARWVNTSVPCPQLQAYTWNRLSLEFRREGLKTVFVSVTLNGVKHYFNQSFNAKPVSNTYEVNVAYQMDGNHEMKDYSTWVDKVSLRYW